MNLTAQLTRYPWNQTLLNLDQKAIAFIAPNQLHSCLYENIQGSISGSASPLVASAYGPTRLRRFRASFREIFDEWLRRLAANQKHLPANTAKVADEENVWYSGYLLVVLGELYYYMRNFCSLIGLEQWYFSLIWNNCMWKLQIFWGQ